MKQPSEPAGQFETFGYALAMRVLQSDLYRQLDDRELAECDELIKRGIYGIHAEARETEAEGG